ncbi:hypothetical protein DXG01_005586 [Tephrocybe rancida]|nr:hypothetical protein DXG01_005586 [Tephrocybe rancida]
MDGNYVNAATAASENLTFSSGDHFVLRSDFKKKLSSGGPGRDSVRLQSNKQYSTSVTMTSTGNNCDSAATNNAGCGVKFSDSRSYGPSLNSNGGGWFAMERTSSFIKVWFWSRSATNVPSDVKNGATSVNTDNWGTPSAYFPSTSCPIGSKFGPHHIIINYYVNNNPSAFTNAYFDFQWLKIYQ